MISYSELITKSIMDMSYINCDILIFCPNIDGHRQVYCSVLTRFFVESGNSVLIAAGSSGQYLTINTEALLLRDLLKQNGRRVTLLSLGNTNDTHKITGYWNDLVRKLEAEFSPKLTIFPTGDELRLSLKDLMSPQHSSIKRAGIFIRYDWLYSGYSYKSSYLLRMHERKSRRFLTLIKAKWREFKETRKKKKIFLSELWNSMGLDRILCTNPDFMDRFADRRFIYLPEIYTDWDARPPRDSDTFTPFLTKWRTFSERHNGKRVILYYGGWAARRGYDLLLKLAIEDCDSVFISCGRPSVDNNYMYDIQTLKKQLKSEDRIFEAIIPFLPHNTLVDKLFNSIDFLILPYRYYYGLSGMMIQSMEYHKPVIVPEIGYMNSMVKQYGIGMTYPLGNFDAFKECYNIMCDIYGDFSENVQSFSKSFAKNKVYQALQELL